MNLDLYGGVISEAERIITGIAEKIDAISREEWLNGSFGGRYTSDNEEEIISRKKMIHASHLESWPEHQLFFKDKKEAETRIYKAFDYIKERKLSFGTLELVCYALISLIYFSMREHDVEEIKEIDICLQENIKGLTENKDEQEYLQILNDLIFLSMGYLYKSINCEEKWALYDEEQHKRLSKREEQYREEYKKLLYEAKRLIPEGKIVELINEIFIVEGFFKNPSKENIEKINTLCFGKKDNWMWHIFMCASQQIGTVDQHCMHYLPHIKFHTSSDDTKLIIEQIYNKKPKKCIGHWGKVTQEELEEEEKELEKKLKAWENEAYLRMFMQPYQINTKESKGQLIYTLLAVLSENKVLEETKNAIVSDFTHSYGNYEIDNVYNIAKALNENPTKEDLENYGRELLLEYLNKQMMTKEVKMLKLEHKDSFNELKEVISNSVTSKEYGVSVYKIINEALKRVVLRILLEAGNNRMEDIRNKYEMKNKDTYDLLEMFEKEVIRRDSDCIDWINKNMNVLNVDISKEWNDIYFRKNSEGNVFLMSLLMELCLNMFTYADINFAMNICFFYEETADENYLMIKSNNVVDENILSNTKKGLAARNRILSKINYGKDYRWRKSILKEYTKDNTECTVSARIISSLFGGII